MFVHVNRQQCPERPYLTDRWEDVNVWAPILGPSASVLLWNLSRYTTALTPEWRTAAMRSIIGDAPERRLVQTLDRLAMFGALTFTSTNVLHVQGALAEPRSGLLDLVHPEVGARIGGRL